VLGGGICECLWLGDNDVTLSMVKRAYQNFNKALESSLEILKVKWMELGLMTKFKKLVEVVARYEQFILFFTCFRLGD
jgi:hypothetical protein